jgi:predicted lactoylglutathione lyase
MMIFVNLPVTDLARSTAFYEALGAKKDERFCDDTASAMVLSDTIVVMLLTHDKFRVFTTREIADAKTSAQAILAISAQSRAAVDDLVNKAGAAGGTPDHNSPEDYGFMYGRGFEDPDGHLWGVHWMDMDAFMAAKSQVAA